MDNVWFEGILHTAISTDGGVGVVLKMASKKSIVTDATTRTKPLPGLVINSKDFVQLKAVDATFDEKVGLSSSNAGGGGGFATDVEISGADRGGGSSRAV